MDDFADMLLQSTAHYQLHLQSEAFELRATMPIYALLKYDIHDFIDIWITIGPLCEHRESSLAASICKFSSLLALHLQNHADTPHTENPD